MLASLGELVAVKATLAEALAAETESVTVAMNANVVIDFDETTTAETLTIVENKAVRIVAAESLAESVVESDNTVAVTDANNLRAKATAVAAAEATANTALAEAEAVAATDDAVTVKAVAADDSLLLGDADLLVLNTMAAESGVTADLVGTLFEGLLVAVTLVAMAEAATADTVAVAETVAETVAVAEAVAVAVAVIEAKTVVTVSDVMVLGSAGDSSERSDEVSANHFNERGNVEIFCCFFQASKCF